MTGTFGTGRAFTFLLLARCMAMMYFLMRGTGGMSHGGSGSDAEDRDTADHKH